MLKQKKKVRRGLGTSGTILNVPTSESQGCHEEKKEEQEVENFFVKVMKENFPNLAKEIDFQEIQEAQRVPKKFYPKRNTPRHIIIKLPKIKYKKRILKAARGKDTVTYKGVPISLSASFSRDLTGKKGLERSI